MLSGIGRKVFRIAVRTKPSTNHGNIFTMLRFPVDPDAAVSAEAFARSFLVVYTASTRVIGTIIRVLVSLTMVAKPRAVLLPAALLHAAPAATTDDVSLIAVPAHIPKPKSDNPIRCPRGGKIKTATTLNRKMVDIACATSWSFAPMTGAVAAMADPRRWRCRHL